MIVRSGSAAIVATVIGVGLAGGAFPAAGQDAGEAVTPQALFQMLDAFNAAAAAYALCGEGDAELQDRFAVQYDSLAAEVTAMMTEGLPDVPATERATLLERRQAAVAAQIQQAHDAEGCGHEGVDSFTTLYRVFAVAERED